MKKILPLLATTLSLTFASCANIQSVRTNYVAPSSAGVKTSVASAQQKVTSAQTHAKTSAGLIVQSSAAITAAADRAKTVTDRLKVIATATAGTPAVSALVLQVQGDVDFLTKTLLGVRTANDALAVENAGLSDDLKGTTIDLGVALTRIDSLQKDIYTQTTTLITTSKNLNIEIARAAADKAVVAQVNSWWGLGAFAYGIKRLLTHLLWLALGIVVLIVALVILATVFPAFGAVFAVIMAFIRMIFARRTLSPIATYPVPRSYAQPAVAAPIAPDSPVIAPDETSPASRAAAAPLTPRPPKP
jgi:hypothetical protein